MWLQSVSVSSSCMIRLLRQSLPETSSGSLAVDHPGQAGKHGEQGEGAARGLERGHSGNPSLRFPERG